MGPRFRTVAAEWSCALDMTDPVMATACGVVNATPPDGTARTGLVRSRRVRYLVVA